MIPLLGFPTITMPAAPPVAKEIVGNVLESSHTNTKKDLAQFYHQPLLSPPKSMLLAAIKNGHLASFPGLTTELIQKHLPPSTATDKGHLHRVRQGFQSTRSNTAAMREARAEVDDMQPKEEMCVQCMTCSVVQH